MIHQSIHPINFASKYIRAFEGKYYTDELLVVGTFFLLSAERRDVEHREWVNTTAEAQEYISRHPDIWRNYLQEIGQHGGMVGD